MVVGKNIIIIVKEKQKIKKGNIYFRNQFTNQFTIQFTNLL
jgi:hypothetical protein